MSMRREIANTIDTEFYRRLSTAMAETTEFAARNGYSKPADLALILRQRIVDNGLEIRMSKATSDAIAARFPA